MNGRFFMKEGNGTKEKASFNGFERVTKPPTMCLMYSPANFATPVPKMVSARPVTFWFALRVMVMKEKRRPAMAPMAKEERTAHIMATRPLDAPTPTAAS